MMSSSKKRAVALLLAVVLSICTMPADTMAAEAPWASDAVNVLNSIYPGNFFSASDNELTVNEVDSFISDTLNYQRSNVNFYPKNHIFTGGGSDNLTRKEACAVIFAVLQLPGHSGNIFDDCHSLAPIYKDAIGCMRHYGVLMGMPDGSVNPEGIVDMATFAVMFYRALRATGNLQSHPYFLPGEYGAFEVNYLELRSCLIVDFGNSVSDYLDNFTDMMYDGFSGTVTINAYDSFAGYPIETDYSGDNDIWNAWADHLNYCADFTGIRQGNYNFGSVPTSDFLEAIIEIVKLDRLAFINDGREQNAGLFSDVSPGRWYYDGVMYLRNHSLVSGYGDGQFGSEDELSRGAMASIGRRIERPPYTDPTRADLCAMFPDEWSDTDQPGWIKLVDNPGTPQEEWWCTWRQLWFSFDIYWAVDQGYMDYVDGIRFECDSPMTREEMFYIVADKLYKFESQYSVNLNVLDRFIDKDQIDPEYRPAVAYLVSIGVLGGTGAGTLDPDSIVSRGMAGAFLARVLDGLDKSWMKDYKDVVNYVLE